LEGAKEGVKVAKELWKGSPLRQLSGWQLWRRSVERQWNLWDSSFRHHMISETSAALRKDSPTGNIPTGPLSHAIAAAVAQAAVTVAAREWPGGWKGLISSVAIAHPLVAIALLREVASVLGSVGTTGTILSDGRRRELLSDVTEVSGEVGKWISQLLGTLWAQMPSSCEQIKNCLQVINEWVPWSELESILPPPLPAAICELLQNVLLRQISGETLLSILSRKVKPSQLSFQLFPFTYIDAIGNSLSQKTENEEEDYSFHKILGQVRDIKLT